MLVFGGASPVKFFGDVSSNSFTEKSSAIHAIRTGGIIASLTSFPLDMGVSINGGIPKSPQHDHFSVGKPIVVGYHHFRKPPYFLSHS